MKQLLLGFTALALACTASADTIVGSWTDSTPTGVDYVPQYNAECRLVGQTALTYEAQALANPEFSATITVPDLEVLECRVRNANVKVASDPLYSNWTPWTSATVAVTPADPTSVLFILVK
jgi:hypothetical protein